MKDDIIDKAYKQWIKFNMGFPKVKLKEAYRAGYNQAVSNATAIFPGAHNSGKGASFAPPNCTMCLKDCCPRHGRK